MNIKEKLRKHLPGRIWTILSWAKNKWLIFRYRNFGRTYCPAETSKAHARREKEGFFDLYCKGKGLDVGFGGDPIIKNVEGFDFEHGDAQFLNGVKDYCYDFVYSSHTIEHLPDPYAAIKNWFRVVKPGGYLILYIPHRDLYEKKKTLPSVFNPTHLHFFLPDRDEEPDTIGILPLIERSIENYQLIYLKVCDAGLNIKDSLTHSEGEYSVEVVLKKLK
jgi:SAM-dependent methyltransferase